MKMTFTAVFTRVFPRAAVRLVAIPLLMIVMAFLAPRSLMGSDESYKSPIASGNKELKMSPQELRIRVRAMIRPVLGSIEESADQIIVNTSDPGVRRGLLVAKIEMTTTMLSTLLRSDPVVALADAWGYAYQIEAFLKRPDIKSKWGQSAVRASAVIRHIDGMFRDFVASTQSAETANTFAANVRKWADQTPIEGELYRRISMDSEVAEALGRARSGGAWSALGNLEETTADVMTRMDFYTMYLPRLARWEAELGVDDLVRGVDPQHLGSEFERITGSIGRIAALTETVAVTIEKERIATLDGIKKIVDHAFFRLVQLSLICAALAALVLAFHTYFLKRK
jgi:hypothetical protein